MEVSNKRNAGQLKKKEINGEREKGRHDTGVEKEE